MKKIMIIPVLALLAACQNNSKSNSTEMSVDFDSTFCTKLMPGTGGGITGGDGAISIDLKDGSNVFMWGDSFIGDVVDDVREDSSKFIIGNTFTIINTKGELTTLYGGDRNNPTAFIPAEQEGKAPVWYWPGHGFVKDGIMHLFMSKFRKTGEGAYGFEYICCDYFRLDVKTMTMIDKTNFSAANINGVHYGHAVMPYKGEIYIYGTKGIGYGMADVHVAKARLKEDRLSDFSYWDGKDWQNNPDKSLKLAGIKKSVSEQFNVFELEDKIVLLTQDRIENVKDIYSYTADSPVGPFWNEKLLYTINEPNFEVDSMMTYNTMAHPQFIKDDKILVCYNVNTHDLEKVFKKASLYQPRFLWMPIDMILK